MKKYQNWIVAGCVLLVLWYDMSHNSASAGSSGAAGAASTLDTFGQVDGELA